MITYTNEYIEGKQLVLVDVPITVDSHLQFHNLHIRLIDDGKGNSGRINCKTSDFKLCVSNCKIEKIPPLS